MIADWSLGFCGDWAELTYTMSKTGARSSVVGW
jgi:hypothetical protein